jgi:hypothetical protein
MSSAGLTCLTGTADFFGSMITQKAHWYNLTGPSNSDPSTAGMSKIFPSLYQPYFLLSLKLWFLCYSCVDEFK